MAVLKVRNLHDEARRVFRPGAAENRRSAESEVREIPASTVIPGQCVRMDAYMAATARENGLTNKGVIALEKARYKTPAEPLSLSMLNVLLKSALFFLMCLGLALPVFGQYNREEVKKKVDAIVAQAYKEAVVKFPCRLRTSGKAKMGRWRDVEDCVNPAHDLVDWEGHAGSLEKIREQERVPREELADIVEAALTEHALLFDKVFQVKEKEEGAALLPLSNSLLKFLPENSLPEFTVYSKAGDMLGVFIGKYSFERSGGLEILTGYSMVNFQYTDLHGNAQAPGERFLLDYYGVPWRDARQQPGFRLPSNRLLNWR